MATQPDKFLEEVSQSFKQKIGISLVTCSRPRMGSAIHSELPSILLRRLRLEPIDKNSMP